MARDMLSWGSTHLQAQALAHMSQDIVYRRDSDSAAVRGRKTARRDQQVDAGTGILTAINEWDWIIEAVSIAGIVSEPRVGDLIVETIGSTEYTYEVTATGAEREWIWNDRNQTTFRIHTKRYTPG